MRKSIVSAGCRVERERVNQTPRACLKVSPCVSVCVGADSKNNVAYRQISLTFDSACVCACVAVFVHFVQKFIEIITYTHTHLHT